METGEYKLTRGTPFVARCLEVVTVAGLIGFRGVFSVGRIFSCFFISFSFSLNAHGLLQVQI